MHLPWLAHGEAPADCGACWRLSSVALHLQARCTSDGTTAIARVCRSVSGRRSIEAQITNLSDAETVHADFTLLFSIFSIEPAQLDFSKKKIRIEPAQLVLCNSLNQVEPSGQRGGPGRVSATPPHAHRIRLLT